MPTRIPLLAAAVLAVTLAGCLEARTGHRNGQTDTVSGDTTATDTTVVDPCASKACDDGDPCTIDSCDPVTGDCVFASATDKKPGPAEPPECYADDQCDDGDPCTADVCRATSDDCGESYWAYCENTPIAGCGCTLETCDDGDPCTADTCVGNVCTHTVVVGCGNGCSGVNAIDAAELEWTAWPGDAVKVAGVAAPYTFNIEPVCMEAVSEGEGGEPSFCECCVYPIGLATSVEADAALQIVPPMTADGPAWRCSEGCGTTCSPMLADAAYWAWGTARSSWMATRMDPPGEQAGVARPPTDGLDIGGWCLQTNAQGLPGSYLGEVRVDGYEQAIPFEAEIAVAAGGGLQISLWPAECTSAECPTWIHEVIGTQTSVLEAGDGSVSFAFEMIGICNRGPTIPVRADLVSYHNTLSGGFYQSWQTFSQGAPQEDIAYCSSGTVSLTRRW